MNVLTMPGGNEQTESTQSTLGLESISFRLWRTVDNSADHFSYSRESFCRGFKTGKVIVERKQSFARLALHLCRLADYSDCG